MTKDQIEILEKIKADSSKQKALDYLIKSFPELNEDYILCEIANYEIDGFDYRNPVVHRYVAYVDAVEKLQEENKQLKEQIEKMKNCCNCKHWEYVDSCKSHTCIKDGEKDKNYRSCIYLEKWEMKE